jgi:4-hydroxy-tetrahydrodipicolinate synthase
VTPRGKNGDVDFGATFELLDHLARGGAEGVALFAAEGEYPAFTTVDRARLCKLAVKRSRLPVLAGVSSASLDDSLELARAATDAGADALLLAPPHFFEYDQDDIRAFYYEFAETVGNDPPVLLYAVKGASAISGETAADLMASGLFAGIVCPGEVDGEFRALSETGLLLGSDAALMEGYAGGVVSGAACAAPEVVAALHRAQCAGDAGKVEHWRGCLRELLAWAARFPQPTLWKTATELRGLKTGPVAAALSARKQRELAEFREWFRCWMPRVRAQAANG